MPNGRRFRFQLCRVANSGKIDFCRSQKKCVHRRRRILRLNHKLSLVKGKICRKLNLKNNLAISLFLLPSKTIIKVHSRKSRVLTPSNYNNSFFIKSLHIESAVSFERKNRLTFGNKITADVSSLIRPRYRFDVKKCFKKFKSDLKIYIILLAKKIVIYLIHEFEHFIKQALQPIFPCETSNVILFSKINRFLRSPTQGLIHRDLIKN